MANSAPNPTNPHVDEMVARFAYLEQKYDEWFAKKEASIIHFFIDRDYHNELVPDCELPEHIKVECALIKYQYERNSQDEG